MEDALREDGTHLFLLHNQVLILVLMEDALRDRPLDVVENPRNVLILVLMEDALRGHRELDLLVTQQVLILVLMEDALREHNYGTQKIYSSCLNPCSNGRCSARMYYMCQAINLMMS